MSQSNPLDAALAAIANGDPRDLCKARPILTAYHARWYNRMVSEFEVLKVEKEFAIPLINPETNAASRTFRDAGKIDAVLKRRTSGRIVVLEHKTTMDDIANDSDYWTTLGMDPQISRYTLALMSEGHDVECVLYDVMLKPAQKLSHVPLVDRDDIKIVHNKAGERVYNANGKPRQTGDAEKGYVLQTREERLDEFEARVGAAIQAEPDRFYSQREIPLLNTELLEYASDAWALGQQILYFRNAKIWPRNTNACDAFGKCEFFDLCAKRASVDGIRFRVGTTRHKELKMVEADGKEFLTNSRGAALKKCARYHKLKYEDKIERVAEEDEALRLGSMVHLGLEHYYTTIMQNQTH